ncbi:MAG TPA: peptide ABC transporter substrate-binding protein [Gemmatimonadaceae bacterium]|nr:peptide ABC transporter substrate-binding protein [Gemmatimonadaceae bacterium]
MRARRLASTALAALVALGAGCAPAERSRDAVVIASGADLESANPLVTIHPLSRQVQRYALFVTLARLDERLEPVPYLAREWRWSADRTRLSLSLLSGLRWHDGHPTTARDVAFTIDAARDPATGYPRYADLADVAAVETQGDSLVALRFARPQSGFPMVLCELPIVPEHLLGAVPHAEMRRARFNEAPVGNGPFRFVERRPKQRWVFARNDGFPAALGGPPEVARAIIAVVDEPTTKFAGLVGGELDVAGIAPGMASLVRRDPSLRVLDYPVLFSTAIIFNVHKAPWDDARVRRAVALSLDRRRIIDAALAGYATPAGGPVPPDHPYASAAADTLRDTARADALLDSAGWRRDASGLRRRGGRPLAMELLTVGSGDNAIEQLIQADLAARGIGVTIRQRELGAFLSEARASRRTFDALFTGIPGDLSLAYLSAMFDSRLAGGALDYAGYHTPRLDSLLRAAREAASEQAARDGWAAVQRELDRQAPAAWVYHSRGLQGLSRRLHGVTMDLRGELVTLARWSVMAPAELAHR